jgi:dCTP deaminase
MTIKSDKWIRRMAEEHGMISPFEPEMIREKEGKKNCIFRNIKLWV